MQTVVVDFDGTIRNSSSGLPIEGAKESLEKLKAEGFTILICSCRTNHEFCRYPIARQEEVKFMENFLRDNEVPFDEVLNNDKPIADYYLDDCGRRINNNWFEVVDSILQEEKGSISEPPEELHFELIAFLDAYSANQYQLFLAYDNEPYMEIKWPDDWDDRVSEDFLRRKGFNVKVG